MKIAFIIYPEVIISNKSNGIRSQAVCWSEILKKMGHTVDLISCWGDYNWKEYDILHVFGTCGSWGKYIGRRLSEQNPNIVLSPIFDPKIKQSLLEKYFRTHIGKWTFNIVNINESQVYQQFKYTKMVFARSEFERKFIQKIYNIQDDRLTIVPLSYSDIYDKESFSLAEKENFCLHISSIWHDRKNVVRLVQAAKKYNFELILAGSTGTSEQFKPIKEAIGDATNIRVLGFISEEQKLELYKKAKVFALPSTNEGVGIVAVDAALLGDEIVITNIPGPKEYYSDKACVINPFNVDEIGMHINSLLKGKISFQPELSNHIRNHYSPIVTGNKLIEAYKKVRC